MPNIGLDRAIRTVLAQEKFILLKQIHKQIITAAIVLHIFVISAAAQRSAPIVVGEQFTIHSDILNEDRAIFVTLPPGYEFSPQKFPVIYLLDGPAHLNHTTGIKDVLARSNRMPQAIIVGIANTDRTRDLTPSPGNNRRLRTAGGADNFLEFINRELVPHIEKKYRTEPYRVLIGHSFGGLFAIHTMATQPDSFDAYIAISPSLEWADGATVKHMSKFLDVNSGYEGFLYFTIADEGGPMQLSFDSLVGLLESKAPQTLHWENQLLPDEDHGSTVIRSTYHGLKALFSDWQPTKILASGDVEAIKKHFAGMTKKYKFDITPAEQPINQLGYRFMLGGELEKAIAIFKFNIEIHPESANVYDSLGEAYETTGKVNLALHNYKKAVKQGQKINDPSTPTYQRNYNRVSQSRGSDA